MSDECRFNREDRDIIRSLANGDNSKRESAIAIFHAVLRSIPSSGEIRIYRSDPYFAFMSEVDNPCPCYVLKANARAAILKDSSNA
jgi:hypothetical protein